MGVFTRRRVSLSDVPRRVKTALVVLNRQCDIHHPTRYISEELMVLRSINYSFSQRFEVPAREAYKWCTDYEPEDLSLMGEKGTRKIERMTPDTIVLYDSFRGDGNGKRFVKKKLVRLNPRTLSWTNTHIAGPLKFSQFLYRIVPEGARASRLDFVGLQVQQDDAFSKGGETGNATTPASALSARYRKEDSAAWKRLAEAMNEDLAK
jgi:hypothetical protein